MSDSAKYRRAIEATAKESKGKYALYGDLIIVEMIDLEQYQKSSPIIISQGAGRQTNGMTANLPTFARIVMVGDGYTKEDGTPEPVEAEVGDIILVGQNSVQEFSQFGKINNYGRVRLGITRASEALMRFSGQEGFDSFFDTALQVLNGEEKTNIPN